MKTVMAVLLSVMMLLLGTACGAGTSAGKGGSGEARPTAAMKDSKEALPLKEKKVMSVKLNSGYEMPVIGLGTWTQNNVTAAESVYFALKNGYRLIDTARYYGNEKGVGEGLKRAISEKIVARKDVFITSKIMPGNYNNAASAIEASLQDLDIDYLDLMLIHQPGSNDKAVYQAMEQAVKNGKIRSIGISNYYTRKQVEEVLSFATIVPAVIQNENHIFYQNAELQNFVKPYGIVIESWYPFGGRGNTKENFENKTVTAIAQAHGRTPAQIILRWQIQAGYVAVPGSANPNHIAENIAVFDFSLSAEEMKKIAGLNKHQRYENW